MTDYTQFSRKPRRLAGFDYRTEALYFVTLCTKDRICYFGEVLQGEMELSDIGIIVRDYWLDIPYYHPQVLLGEMVVMPNHIHALIGIEKKPSLIAELSPEKDGDPSETTLRCNAATEGDFEKNANQVMSSLSPKAGTLSRIIGSYKTACTRMIKSVCTAPFSWQSHFHDRIIRDEWERQNVESYILNNPSKWEEDVYADNYTEPPFL
jgi:hypothetical protein